MFIFAILYGKELAMIYGWDTDETFVFTKQEFTTNTSYTHSHYTSLILSTGNIYHAHDYWEIFYILSGNATHYINGHKTVIGSGDCYILRPGDKHCIDRIDDKNNVFLNRDFYVLPDKMKKICDFLDESGNLLEKLEHEESELTFKIPRQKLEVIEKDAQQLSQDNDPVLVEMLFQSVVSSLVAGYCTANGTEKIYEAYPTWLRQLLETIQNDAKHEKSLSELVSSTGYCHAHVSREFKKYMGVRLNEYLLQQKLRYSTTLLENHENSIADISYLLGFANESNYICSFKKYYHLTPHKWRMQFTRKH